MELFTCPAIDGKPDEKSGQFNMLGMVPLQQIDEMAWQLGSATLNTAIAVSVVTKRMNAPALTDRMAAVIAELATATGSTAPADLDKALKALKAKQARDSGAKPPTR